MAKKLSPWSWFPIASAIIAIGVVLLFNINSYFADNHGLYNVYLIGGIVIILIGVYLMWAKVVKRSNTQPQEK